jgi:hypothetical protein
MRLLKKLMLFFKAIYKKYLKIDDEWVQERLHNTSMYG